jgi:hypothetical protein
MTGQPGISTRRRKCIGCQAVDARGFRGFCQISRQRRALVVAHLAFGEEQDHGAALTVADGVELGVQATFGAPDTAGNSPF